MRRVSTALIHSTALVLAVAAVVVAAPASAVPVTGGDSAGSADSTGGGTERARLRCETAVLGVDGAGHVRDDVVVNDRLVHSRRSAEALPFGVTALGYFDSRGTSKRVRSQVNVVTADGRPRRVTLTRTRSALRVGQVRAYDQKGFEPRLYADGYTFYAYTVSGGTMKRWTLTRFPDGEIRYAQPVRIGKGLRDLTSLLATTVARVRGVPSEVLYATTSSGQLRQLVVPLERPQRLRVHRLASSGYAGVTELSWTVCDGKRDLHSLIAIDPVANRATWTTVKRALSDPRSKLRSEVTGQADWSLTAAL